LYCFDKSTCSKFAVNIRNIACETCFYDTDEDVGQDFEKTLSYSESHFKSVCSKLIQAEDLSCLTTREKKWMAAFIAVQLVRTKEHRVMLKQWIHWIKQQAQRRRVTVEDLWPAEETTTEEGIRSLHMRDFENVPELVYLICQKKWILLINQTTMPYWSSDNPVNPPNVVMPLSDFRSSTNQIQIPLSPKVSIWLCEPTMYKSLRSKYEITDIQKIIFLNSLQVFWSTRYIFSAQNDFSFAEQIIRNYPSLGDMDRERLSVD